MIMLIGCNSKCADEYIKFQVEHGSNPDNYFFDKDKQMLYLKEIKETEEVVEDTTEESLMLF